MAPTIFELDAIRDLPLWAQVLIASRLCRRATLWLVQDTPPKASSLLLAGCDAVDRCALYGQRPKDEIAIIEHAIEYQPSRDAQPAFAAMYYTADAAMAAEASLDFEAAESACTQSVLKAMASVAEQNTLSPIQARIFAAADLDLLRFACKENNIGRYNGLGTAVFRRLIPVTAPNPQDIRPRVNDDPQYGFR